MGCIVLVRCVLVGVTVWFGWGGVVSVCRLKFFSLHTDTTPPQSNHNVTPKHIEPEQYNPWNNSTNKSQAPEDGCINTRNMLTTPPQPNHNVTPKHIEPEQYNPWKNSTNMSQAPEDGCINIRNMLTTPPQPNHNVTPNTSNQNNTTHERTQQIRRKLLRMVVITSETCWVLNNEIIKQVTSRWSLFIQLSTWNRILVFGGYSKHRHPPRN